MDPGAQRTALIRAARDFNAGRYFEAHEHLEEALDELPDELWDLFLGLIQIAVGYHKATQRLWPGAARMLGIGLEKIEGLEARGGGVRLEPLRERARSDRESILRGTFDPEAFLRNPPRLQPLPGGFRSAEIARPG